MIEINRQEYNAIVARVTAMERTSDGHGIKIEQLEDSRDTMWQSIDKFRETTHAQGTRLAIIFGGISVIVTGIGMAVAVSTLMKNLSTMLAH